MIKDIEKFWDARPCNVRHSKKEIGTREYFDEVEKKKYLVEPHIKSFAEFSSWNNKDVLEIGCGIGTDSVNFARNGANLSVVELSEASLELCKQRFNIYDLDAEFYRGNSENLNDLLPAGEKFDLIYSFGVIHHTEFPERIIEQIKSRLKPSGELRIMLYSKYSFKLFDFMHTEGTWDFSRTSETIKYYAEAQLGCPQALTYTFSEIRSLLKDFDIYDMKKEHIFKYDIPEYIKGNYVITESFKNMTEESFAEMSEEMGWHTLVKATLREK